MIRLSHRILLVVLLLFGAIAASGCGDGDEDCASDHDCPSDRGDHEMVCEPDGCRLACSDDTDCPATDDCTDRRVEPGRVCVPNRETL